MIKHLLFLAFSLLVVPFSFGQKAEAEDGTLSGTEKANSRVGFSGTGYVTGFDNNGDAVSMKVTVTKGGLYNLFIGNAAPYGEKTNTVYVNGESKGDLITPASMAFTETLFGKVVLKEGVNAIKIEENWGYFEVDYVRVEPTLPSEINNFAESLVNPGASGEANILYQYLKDAYGKRIISGQQNESNYTQMPEEEFEYILEKTGKQPAMRGFDFIDYSPSRVEKGASSNELQKIIDWHEKGGIVEAAWHWNAPKDLYETEDQPWWRGFYTEATGFDFTIAMNDESSEEYELILRDMDTIAFQLKKLKDLKIPVLWRPLHEAEGAWFWWGSKGPEACKWLWKLMFERYVNHHQLDNLIWVWTSYDKPASFTWYPGDEYVDIISADIYLSSGDYSPSFSMFDNLARIFEGGKIIAMSENGIIPDPDRLIDEQAKWSWFCTWSGDFILDPSNNSVTHINKVYNHEYVITLDELPDFKNYEDPSYDNPFEPSDPVTGLKEDRDFDEPFQLHPNPVRDRLTIVYPGNSDIRQLSLLDGMGRLLFRWDGKDVYSGMELDLGTMPPGIYFLNVSEATASRAYKLIKK